MNPTEKKIYDLRIKLLAPVQRPLLKLLTLLHINADMISYTGVLLMLAFVFTINHHPLVGFWLLLVRGLIDGIDGALARYQKTSSDRGKFVDVMTDNTGFALFIFGVINAGLMSGLYGSIYLFLTELTVILMIVRKNLYYKGDWFFFASAGSFPYVLMYAAYWVFAFYAFGFSDFLNGAARLFSILLAFKVANDYWIIQKSNKPNQ